MIQAASVAKHNAEAQGVVARSVHLLVLQSLLNDSIKLCGMQAAAVAMRNAETRSGHPLVYCCYC